MNDEAKLLLLSWSCFGRRVDGDRRGATAADLSHEWARALQRNGGHSSPHLCRSPELSAVPYRFLCALGSCLGSVQGAACR